MNIAVMGHMGMLGLAVQQEIMRQGHILRIFYEENWEIKARRIDHEQLPDDDIQVVINCAGVVPQSGATPKDMVYTNAYAPYVLRNACNQIGARLIHVSTDCVFTAPGPHSEASPLSPSSLYGLSKAAGEISDEPHLTVRTSFVGLGPTGLLHDLMNSEHVNASENLLWNGHTATTVARALVELAAQGGVSGVLHLPGEWTNRYRLCLQLKEYFGLKVDVIKNNTFRADRRLLSTHWDSLGLTPLPEFGQQLKEYIP